MPQCRLPTGPTRPATRPDPANGGAPAPPPRDAPASSSRALRSATAPHLLTHAAPAPKGAAMTPQGPQPRRSRSTERHYTRNPRPLSTTTSPHEPHRASCSPTRRYTSSTRSPRYHHSRTSSSEPSPPLAPAHLAWWSSPALRELHRWVMWAGGAGRRQGAHMIRTFEEILTRTPASPNETAPEAHMPHAAWKTLLRDAVQGLRRP